MRVPTHGIRGAAARVPGLSGAGAAVTYVAATLAALWPSIRPGRTLVPADILTAVTPYRIVAGGFEAQNPVLSDASVQFFPWLHFLGEAWRSGGMPAWNPLLLGGVPMVPNGFVAPDYPGFWLVRWLAPFDAYNVFVAAHLVLAAAGIYALARAVGARPGAAWVAGLGALAAGMWVHWSLHLVHLVGMAWLPWAMAATHRVVVRPSPGRAVALAAVVGLWWLGGNPQYAYFGTLAAGAYGGALVLGRRIGGEGGVVRPALALVAGMAFGAVLAAPALIPAAGAGSWILRDREPVSSMADTHLPTRELARLVVADATGNTADGVTFGSIDEFRMDSPFVGVAVLVLAGAAVGSRRRTVAHVLAHGAATALLLAFTETPHRVLHGLLPGYDRFRGSARWVAVLPAFALPLAALGLDGLRRGDERARRGALAAAGLAALVAGLFWLDVTGDAGAPRGYLGRRVLLAVAVAAAVAGAAWLARRRPVLALVIVAVAVAGEVAFHTPRWYPSVEERRAYPEVAVARIAAARGGRIVRVGLDRTFVSSFTPNVPMVHGIADVQGQAVIFPADVDRFLRLVDDHGDFALDSNIAPDLRPGTDLASPLLDALDVRTVIAESNVPMPAGYPVLDRSEPVVYARASPGAAVLVPRAEPAGERAMWRAVADPRWDPRRTAAVDGLARPVRGGPGRARVLAASAGEERWRVTAPEGGFLRVSATFADGWSARVDGRPVPVLRADGIFRGVVVPPGRHEVSFRYRNPDQDLGRRVALGGWALAAGAALLAGRARVSRRRRGAAPPAAPAPPA